MDMQIITTTALLIGGLTILISAAGLIGDYRKSREEARRRRTSEASDIFVTKLVSYNRERRELSDRAAARSRERRAKA